MRQRARNDDEARQRKATLQYFQILPAQQPEGAADPCSMTSGSGRYDSKRSTLEESCVGAAH